MPNIKISGAKSEINQDLRNKRRKIIEEERIRILGDALMLFYDELMGKYELIYSTDEDTDIEELQRVNREEVEELAREYAASKPIGY